MCVWRGGRGGGVQASALFSLIFRGGTKYKEHNAPPAVPRDACKDPIFTMLQ